MNLHYIELLGEQYPLCLSMTAAQNLTDKFGSLNAMGEQLLHEDVSIRRAAVCDVLTELLKAGRIYARMCGETPPPPLACSVGDLLPPDTAAPITVILETLRWNTARTVTAKDTSKNAAATPVIPCAGRGSTTTEPVQD